MFLCVKGVLRKLLYWAIPENICPPPPQRRLDIQTFFGKMEPWNSRLLWTKNCVLTWISRKNPHSTQNPNYFCLLSLDFKEKIVKLPVEFQTFGVPCSDLLYGTRAKFIWKIPFSIQFSLIFCRTIWVNYEVKPIEYRNDQDACYRVRQFQQVQNILSLLIC